MNIYTIYTLFRRDLSLAECYETTFLLLSRHICRFTANSFRASQSILIILNKIQSRDENIWQDVSV